MRPCQRPDTYRNADGTIQCMFRSYYRIEDLDEVKKAFRTKDPHRKFRVFYRGPRKPYSSNTLKADATHFVVYWAL